MAARRYGFYPYGFVFQTLEFTISSQTIAKGDPLIFSSGFAAIATVTSGTLLGVAAEAKTSSDTTIQVHCSPAQLYIGTCSGTVTQARFGVACDIEGSTGTFLINEDATSYAIILPICLAPGESLSANAEIICKIDDSEMNGANS